MYIVLNNDYFNKDGLPRKQKGHLFEPLGWTGKKEEYFPQELEVCNILALSNCFVFIHFPYIKKNKLLHNANYRLAMLSQDV